MAAIVKMMMNTDTDVVLKIKSDQQGGTAVVTREMLTYKPKEQTCEPDVDNPQAKFQDVCDWSEVTITHMSWSGSSQQGHGHIYRGDVQDLEHMVASFCVGDTCQLDLQGQDGVPDQEYSRQDLRVDLTGEVVLWIRLHKIRFKSYAGEYGLYGSYEDDSRLGPKVD